MQVVLKILAAACTSAAVSLAINATDARADAAYPWCAISSASMGTQACSFATLDQCRAYVAPAGFCQPNPRYNTPAERPRLSRGSRM